MRVQLRPLSPMLWIARIAAILGSSDAPLSIIGSYQKHDRVCSILGSIFFCLYATIRGTTADAVLFEFRPSEADPAMRHHRRRWQPQLRSLFVMRIESFKYRHRVPGYELPDVGRTAQHAYGDRFAAGGTLSAIETR
jgi:hypothetical protein